MSNDTRDTREAHETPYYIVSGEGENGTRELYTGALTARAVKARLTRERAGGDRWARIETAKGERISIDDLDYLFAPNKMSAEDRAELKALMAKPLPTETNNP